MSWEMKKKASVFVLLNLCPPSVLFILQLRRANALHRRLDAFHVMVDHVEQLHSLWQFIHTSSETAKQWSVFIDVDIGYARSRLA